MPDTICVEIHMENERQLWKNRSRVRAAIILKDYPEGIISRKHMRSFSKKGFRQYLSAGLLRRWGAHQQVCTGTTDFAETVKVQYDPDEVDLPFLIDLYFKTIDPTSLNKQGGDRGTQYRTGIYYTDTADLPVIRETVDRLAANYSRPLVVEIEPLKNFYLAEDYHQDYLDKNPGGYPL